MARPPINLKGSTLRSEVKCFDFIRYTLRIRGSSGLTLRIYLHSNAIIGNDYTLRSPQVKINDYQLTKIISFIKGHKTWDIPFL